MARPEIERGRGLLELSPWLLLVIPPLCWAGNFVLGRAVHAQLPPVALTFWRWVVAALVLAPFAARDAWTERARLRRHWRLLLALALTGVAGFQYLVYQGLRTTEAINGVLLMSTIPVAIPVVAFALDGTRLARGQAIGIAVSLLGVLVVVLRGDLARATAMETTPGDLWIALAVPAWALYSVLLRRKPEALAPTTLLFATVLIGVVILAPAWAFERSVWGGFEPTPSTLAVIGYVGIFASVVAFACWNRGVARLGAATAGLYIHLMPVFAALLAVAFLGERLHGYHLAGAFAVATGIWLSSRSVALTAPGRRP